MVQQTEVCRGMVKGGISRPPLVIILALVIRMAGITLLNVRHSAVYALPTTYLDSYAIVAFQAQGTLRGLKRLMAASALRLEGFVRSKTFQDHAWPGHSTQPARAKGQPSCTPEQYCQRREQYGSG